MDGVSLRIDVEQFNDSSKIVIYDKSNWGGHTASITGIKILMSSDVLTNKEFTMDAPTIANFIANKQIMLAPASFVSISPDTEQMPEYFPDGYFEFTILATFADTSTNEYTDNQGFISFLKSEALRARINMPSTEADRFINLHIFLVAAEAAASTGKVEQFKKIVAYVSKTIANYNQSFV